MIPPPQEQESSSRSGRALTVLIADDARDLQELMSQWLSEAGHTVTCVSNGRDIVRLVQARPFDLLVTDIIMPDGDGWDAIAEVHKLRPETRIIAISGGAREMPAGAVLRAARGVGAVGLLQKPFTRIDLLAAIARITRAPPTRSAAV